MGDVSGGKVGWLRELGAELRWVVRGERKAWAEATPLRRIRKTSTFVLVVLGVILLGILVLPSFDRALVLSGHSEFVSMRLDNRDFGVLRLGEGVLRTKAETAPGTGRVSIHLDEGTVVRFIRRGHGPLLLAFEAKEHAAEGGCSLGEVQIGVATVSNGDAEGEERVLCDHGTVRVNLTPASDPLVVALSGNLVVGAEVGQGAGPRPILLDGVASLLVRHGGPPYTWFCRMEVMEHLCERFVANSSAITAGSSVRARVGQGHVGAHRGAGGPELGFIRIDASELGSGMFYLVNAEAHAFEVSRMEGEPFTVRESMVDIITKSPLVHTLNGMAAGAALIWFFLGLGRRPEEHRGGDGGHEGGGN